MIAVLKSCRSGVAALEFALAVPVFLMFLGGTLDIGLANYGRSALANAVAAGAQYAFLQGPAAPSAIIKTYVETVSRLGNVVANVTGPACYCVTGTGPTMTAAGCASTCSDGSAAGYYMIISATYTHQALMPAYSLLGGAAVTESATVRLQ
ncbi:MAG: TadE/TadG family type IV pilus assembly protein [Acetobacteraceae bacterium]